ncbi:hypothetical protein, partial [Klebsiella pneumoniae]|uniref:hypothetical protein n=1 Tax=Klebsiella pneumoniae TaxID=573 RepID=UPI0025B2CA7F
PPGAPPTRPPPRPTPPAPRQGLQQASVEEIAKVPGISHALAEKIFYSLKH